MSTYAGKDVYVVVEVVGDFSGGQEPWCSASERRSSLIEAGLPAERVLVSAKARSREKQAGAVFVVEVRTAGDEETVIDPDVACQPGRETRTRTWVHPNEQARRKAAAAEETKRLAERARLRAEAPPIISRVNKALNERRVEDAEKLLAGLDPIRDEVPAVAVAEKRINEAKERAAKETESNADVESALLEFFVELSDATRFAAQRKAVEAIHRDGSNSNAGALWAQWQRFWGTWRTEGCSELKSVARKFGDAKVHRVVREHCFANQNIDCADGIPGWQHPDEVRVCTPKHCMAALGLLSCWSPATPADAIETGSTGALGDVDPIQCLRTCRQYTACLADCASKIREQGGDAADAPRACDRSCAKSATPECLRCLPKAGAQR